MDNEQRLRNLEARIDALQQIAQLQQQIIDRLTTAVESHQTVIEVAAQRASIPPQTKYN